MFTVVQVDASRAEAVEYLGTKSKFWYRDGDRRMLFKAEERGTGEDWAEKVACELCREIGLPHVHYEMAFDIASNTPGVVSEMFVTDPVALAHGNQLLLAVDQSYPAEGSKYKVRAHTIDAVYEAVSLVRLPMEPAGGQLPSEVVSAPDVFVGYLMLDAWVANQDRHHENWGAVWDGMELYLAPSFDHGASMARNEPEERRRERLTTRDRNQQIPSFARRAKSAFYIDGAATRPLSTVAAWRAFAERTPPAAEAWLRRLEGVSRQTVEELLGRVPPHRMSPTCREFTLELLEENRRRLLNREHE